MPKANLTINTPRGTLYQVSGKNGNVRAVLKWNKSFGPMRTQSFQSVQQVIDSEVLRYSSPYVPFDSGMLDKSGLLHTHVGSGEVVYSTPYARRMYYNPQYRFQGAPMRGAYWFERMKTNHRNDILRSAKKKAGIK